MNKDFILKFLIKFSIAIVGMIFVSGIVVALTTPDTSLKYVGIGLSVGVLCGGTFKIKVILPKLLSRKDERALLIYLLSSLVSYTVFGSLALLYFLFSITGVFSFTHLDIGYWICIITLLISSAVAYFGSIKYFENNM